MQNPTLPTIEKILRYVEINSPTTPTKISRDIGGNYGSVRSTLVFLEKVGLIKITKTAGTSVVEKRKRCFKMVYNFWKKKNYLTWGEYAPIITGRELVLFIHSTALQSYQNELKRG